MDRRSSSNHADPTAAALSRGRPVSGQEAALADKALEKFMEANTLTNILGHYRNICDLLHLKPNVLPLFYPKLKANLSTWKPKALWKKLDLRVNSKCYGKARLCTNTRVLIIGGGPCGLRTAIEAQLLGAKVVVVEKRDRMSRNNVLHLWPFVIDDLRLLAAKKLYGKFCAGSIDHISIMQLQFILLKVALLFGVEVHTEISFERLLEPSLEEKIGWRAEFKPTDHPVSQYEFDVVIGADGKRNTLQGFKRKEFRGKLAIAITANFINRKTEAEACVEEISGVAFIFNQKFFKDLFAETSIDLENIVYYKDDTHYFVMTAKKPSLISKGVIKQDLPDTAKLLAPENVDREALMNYARDAAEFSTNYQMLDLEFAVNHYGQPDVAMFDFTSMYASENASRVIERHGHKLLCMLVGDSLLEPFWPTGSGCARGFLSSLDAAWAIRSYGSGMCSPLEVIAERESIYRLLAQTTPENLNKDYKAYTLDPSTRYPNLNKNLLLAQQVISLYDTDDPKSIEMQMSTAMVQSTNPHEMPKKRRKREIQVDPETLLNWFREQTKEYANIQIDEINNTFRDGTVLCAIVNRYNPDLLDYSAINPEEALKNNQYVFDILEKELGIPATLNCQELVKAEVPNYVLIQYLSNIYDLFRGTIPHIKYPKLEVELLKQDILPPCTANLMSHYQHRQSRHKRQTTDAMATVGAKMNTKTKKRRTAERAVPVTNLDRENRAPPVQTKGERDEDFQARIRGLEDKWRENAVTEKKPRDLLRAIGKIDNSDWNIKEIEKKINENKLGKNVNKDKEKVPKWSREQFLARQTKMEKQHLERQDSTGGKFAEIDKNLKILNQRLMEGSVRDVNQQRVAVLTEKLLPKTEEAKTAPKPTTKPPVVLPVQGKAEICHLCEKRVYLMEQLLAEGKVFHRSCFRCQYCHALLRLGSYLYDRDGKYGYRFYCTQHFGMSGELKANKVARKPSVKLKDGGKSPEKKFLSGVAGLDLLDRVQTPERIEFSNLSTGNASSDQEESLSQMDEDEWTDKNFGASTAEVGSSDDDSSSLSDTESDDEDAYEEALEEPPTKEGTLRWAERYNRRYMRKHDDSDSEDYSSTDHSSYYENSSGEDDSDTATEGEEEILARELRKQEVRVEPPVVHTDTGTDTEIATDDTSDSSGGVQNSATEISTDSEFAHDDPTPTRELPSSVADDRFVTKMRGKYHQHAPQKVQVKSTQPLQKANKPTSRKDIELKFTPLVLASPQILKKPPAQPLLRNEGFALNRTQSTGGIATKVSLELKKKYLLGESSTSNAIQKSGSASTLDSKFKSFHSTISDCQKLLKSVENARAGSIQRTSPLSPLFPVLKDPMKQAIEAKKLDEETPCAVVNETEGRPRSPVHETSIIVPQIDWSQHKPKKVELSMSDSSGSSSSSSSDPSSSESEANNDLQKSPSVKAIPKVDVQNADHLPMDSLNYEVNYTKLDSQTSSINEPPKSISSEKKALNQPKLLPSLDDKLLNQVHQILHGKIEEQPKTADKKSGQSTPSNNDDPATGAVLTETELSDWARDEAASDDFEDVEYELNPDLIEDPKREKKLNNKKVVISKAAFSEFEDLKHVCGKDSKVELMECVNNILNPHLDNIEFMDTGTESSDDGIVEAKNNGYVQFHDEDDIAEDSLSPVINVVEAMSPRIKAAFDEDLDDLSTSLKNTGYCIIDTGKNQYGGEVIDLKPIDLEKLKDKRNNFENEEDSLLVVETGTTTEENTCSDSTVKNLTQLKTDVEKEVKVETVENNNSLNKKRLEDKLAQVKKDMKKLSEQRKADQIEEQNMKNSVEFVQHCQRLQSKVDFGNAKDSIDIRKSRRQSKTGSPPKPDLIQEEKESTPVARSKREQIEMERDQNKRLVEEMVMNKMRAENKSLERKRRNRNSFSPSPSRPFELAKSATGDVNGKYAAPPDVLLSTLQKSETVSTLAELNSMGVSEPKPVPRSKYASRPMSVHSALVPVKLPETPLTNPEAFSLPDIQKALSGGGGGGVGGGNEFKTPKAPPRVKNEEAKRTVEKLKQDARARARLLSDEDLGLSPEDKLARLRQKLNRRGKENDADAHVQESIESLVISTERRNSLLYSNDTLSKKKNGGSFRRSKSGDDSLNSRERTKSVSEMNKSQLNGDGSGSKTRSAKDVSSKCFKSDPNLLNTDAKKKKKGKDPERRRSLTKLLSSFFNKKDSMTVTSSANNHKGFLSRISPKTKDKSKSCVDLLQYGSTVIKEEPVRRSSFTETRKITTRNSSPPPIPPLPLNYTGSKSNVDDSSDGESEWKHGNRGSCDTIDHSSKLDGGSICSLSGRRSSGRSARKVARQSQVKRHRTAQEIQRKLEETEVKIRELEQQGVLIEKALGGELDSAVRASREEADLLKNWFDLMRDTTELRRYERELVVRAEELQLEDRHARLQYELKERLDDEGKKTREDIETEGSILKEMMDIVDQRNRLIQTLEEDRLRYCEEDRNFEEQMLAKGINLAPVVSKPPPDK